MAPELAGRTRTELLGVEFGSGIPDERSLVQTISHSTSSSVNTRRPAGGQAAYPYFSFYIASKWGIEGFCETAARAVAR